MGGRSESYALSYASGPGSRDETLQVSRAGNAGKSLTTQISIRPRQRRRQGDFCGIGHRHPNHFLRGSGKEAGMVPEWSNSAFPPTRTFRKYLRVHIYPRQAGQLRRRRPKDTQSGQALPRTQPAEGQICGRPFTKPVKETALRRAWGRQLGQLERHFLASERHLRQEPSLFQARGCAPPWLGTWGTRPPARRSAIPSPPLMACSYADLPLYDHRTIHSALFWEHGTILT